MTRSLMVRASPRLKTLCSFREETLLIKNWNSAQVVCCKNALIAGPNKLLVEYIKSEMIIKKNLKKMGCVECSQICATLFHLRFRFLKKSLRFSTHPDRCTMNHKEFTLFCHRSHFPKAYLISSLNLSIPWLSTLLLRKYLWRNFLQQNSCEWKSPFNLLNSANI